MDFALFHLPCYREGFSASLGAYYEELIDSVRLADRLGWSRVWQSEHHFHYYGGVVPSSAMMLLAHARATERIRLGVGVALLPLRHPLQVAEDYAMLDQLSGGRLDMGVGRGFLPHEFHGFDVSIDSSMGRFREGFEVLTRAWQGEAFAYAGEHYAFDRLEVIPQPLQTPPPIWVAAARTRESFEWAGHNGYHLMLNRYPMTDEALAQSFEWYQQAYRAAGHPRERQQSMISLVAHVAPTEEAAIAEMMAPMQEYLTAVERLRTGDARFPVEGGDRAAFAFPGLSGDPIDFFRRRTLVGTSDQVVERLSGYREMGFTEVSFLIRVSGLPHDRVLATMEALNSEVRPHFRAS